MSISAVANDLGVSQPTVKRWLNVLRVSSIIDLVEPWHTNASKRLVKTPKLYFNDTGLCTFLAGINSPDELLRSPLLGAYFETSCYIQLQRYYQNQGLKKPVHFFRTRDGEEVDFIIAQGDRWLAFECKYAENPIWDVKGVKKLEDSTGMKVARLCVLNSGRQSYVLDRERGVYAVSCVDAGQEGVFLGH